REHRVGRAPTQHLRGELGHVAVGPEGDQFESIRMAREHIESALANRSRRTQNGDADHAATPSTVNPNSGTGAAPVTLSMRSMTPPCPGNRVPLSLSPANRFRRLSVRSPTTENATAARHRGRNAYSGTENQALPAIPTSALAAAPPNT